MSYTKTDTDFDTKLDELEEKYDAISVFPSRSLAAHIVTWKNSLVALLVSKFPQLTEDKTRKLIHRAEMSSAVAYGDATLISVIREYIDVIEIYSK